MLAQNRFRIRGNDVRPLHRDGADRPIIHLKEEPPPHHVVPLPHADQGPLAQGVERMGDHNKRRGGGGNACTP
jgi:hypothetical protein